MPSKAAPQIKRYLILLNLLRGLIITAAILCFFFGIGRFRDGPIHPCEKNRGYLFHDHPYGYCGKQGQSHNAADFKNYQKWEDITEFLWSLMILCVASFTWQAKKQEL